MSETVTLPSGAEIVIRDADSIRVRDRRELMADIEAATKGMHSLSERRFMNAVCIFAFAIEKWTVDSPLLSKLTPAERVDLLDQWTPLEYDALDEALKPIGAALFPDFSPSPDRESPTEP
jgi:hypothetical protein